MDINYYKKQFKKEVTSFYEKKNKISLSEIQELATRSISEKDKKNIPEGFRIQFYINSNKDIIEAQSLLNSGKIDEGCDLLVKNYYPIFVKINTDSISIEVEVIGD